MDTGLIIIIGLAVLSCAGVCIELALVKNLEPYDWGNEIPGNEKENVYIYNTKCQYCRQWATRGAMCKHCGAPVN